MSKNFSFKVATKTPDNGDFRNPVPDIEYVAPTVKETGSVTANLIIEDETDTENPIKTAHKLEVEVPKVIQNSANDAKTAAEKAVKQVEVTFADFDKDGKGLSSKQTELLDAAEEVIDTDTYKVEVKMGLELVAGTATEDAYYTITISITNKDSNKSSDTAELKFDASNKGRLTQSLSDAVTQANAALAELAKEGLDPTKVTDKTTANTAVMDAVKKVLIKKTADDGLQYVVQWGINEANIQFQAAEEGKTGSIEGKLYITNIASTPKEKSSAIDVNITIKAKESSSGRSSS